jgi:hypothetical protein
MSFELSVSETEYVRVIGELKWKSKYSKSGGLTQADQGTLRGFVVDSHFNQ